MRLLAVPNWSFGRSKLLLREFQDILNGSGLETHFLQSDLDHNRTVSAFSGEPSKVVQAIYDLCEKCFEAIDLNHHVGGHPRIGALDVCPFVPIFEEGDSLEKNLACALEIADITASELAKRFGIPIFLYEKSARPGHISSLPKLRKKGFGGLLEEELDSDYGPRKVHPQLGVTVLGVRDFLVALNLMFDSEYPAKVKEMASRVRELRRMGDHRFQGVRALGIALPSRSMSQLSLNITQPDVVSIDTIVKWGQTQGMAMGVKFSGTELIGVIRPRDLEHGTEVFPRKSQIIDGC